MIVADAIMVVLAGLSTTLMVCVYFTLFPMFKGY